MDDFQYVEQAIKDVEAFAHGRHISGQIECPRCGGAFSLSYRTTMQGKAYSGSCSKHGCIRWYHPELLPSKQRSLGI